jgi:hypothetical protein
VKLGSDDCHWSAQVNRDGRQIAIQAPAAGFEINGRTQGREECAKGMTEIRTQAPLDGILASFVFTK